MAAGALIHVLRPGQAVMQLSTQHSRKSLEAVVALPPLKARLDDLKQRAAKRPETARNPFKFYLSTSPPLQDLGAATAPAPSKQINLRGMQPALASPRTIPIKFIGVLAQGTNTVAIFTDGTGMLVWASEGQTVLGQFKLLKINVESVTMSYLDGSGTQAIPMRG